MALVTIKSGLPKNTRHIYLTMQSYQKEFVRIKEVLEANPKGMTITDISRAINVNRNSVAKYLELLQLSGHVEMRFFGPAKVFFISHRVPLSVMLNFSSDYILVLNRDLKIVQVTDNLLDFLNLEREVLLGHRIEDISLPIFTSSEIMSYIKEALDGKDSSMELSLQMAEAGFCFKIKLIPTTFDNGTQGVTALLENITEQKRAEEFLRESEEKLRSVLNSMDDLVFVIGTDGTLKRYYPTSAKEDFYVPAEKYLGKHFRDVFPPNVARLLQTAMKEIKESDEIQQFGYSLEINDQEYWFNASISPIKTPSGSFTELTAVVRNITKRKKTEKSLHKSEARYRLLAENVTDVIWTMDLNLQYTYISPSIERQRGYSIEDAMALTIDEILTPPSYEVAMNALEEELPKAIEKETDLNHSHTLELELYCKDGSTIWTESIMTFLRDSDGRPTGILGVTRDITDRKRAEEQLEYVLKRERIALDISIIQRIILLVENARSEDDMLETIVDALVKALQSEIGIIAKLDKDSQLEIMKQIGLCERDMNRKLSLERIAVADEARIYNADEMSKTVLQRLLPHYSVFSSIICPVHSNIFNGLVLICRLYPEKFTERDLRIVSVVITTLETKLRKASKES